MLHLAKALPAGDIPKPNNALQVKWFHTSFHSEYRTKYLKSRQCPANKKLESVTKYFENIFNSQVADGSLTKKRKRAVSHGSGGINIPAKMVRLAKSLSQE